MDFKRLLTGLLCLVVFSAISSPLVGIQTIGTGKTFTTVNDAIDALQNFGIQGDVVFQIDDGGYALNRSINFTISKQNATDRITFESTSGTLGGVKFAHTANGSADNYIISLQDQGYFSFKNIVFEPGNSRFCVAIQILGTCHNISIDKCEFTGLTFDGDVNSQDGDLLSIVEFNNNSTMDIDITGNKFVNGNRSIGFHATQTFHERPTLEGNELLSAKSHALFVNQAKELDAVDNIFKTANNEGQAFLTMKCGAVKAVNNFFDWAGVVAISLQDQSQGEAQGDAVFINNRVKMANGIAMFCNNSDRVIFVHNTFYSTGDNNGTVQFNSSTNYEFKNNLVVNTMQPSLKVDNGFTPANFFGNVSYNSTNGSTDQFVVLDGTGKKIDEWQATGAGTNSSFIPPDWKDIGNLLISCNTLIGMKVPSVSGFPEATSDFEGDARGGASVLVGADEWKAKNGDLVSVSGNVDNGGDKPTGGMVYVLADATNRVLLDTVGKTSIKPDGSFDFTKIGYYASYYFYIDASDAQFVPSYHDKSIGWENATTVTPDGCFGYSGTVIPRKIEVQTSGTNKISGQIVLEATGKATNPIPGLDVVLDKIPPAEGTTVAVTQTDANGNYSFNNLPNNTYVVKVDYAGLGLAEVNTVTFNGSGETVTDVNYCVDTLDNIDKCNPITSINSVVNESFGVYPNPAYDNVTIQSSSSGVLRLFSIHGTLVGTYQLSEGMNTIAINQFASGIYTLNFQTVSGSLLKRKVVVK